MIVACGTPFDIIKDGKHSYTARFLREYLNGSGVMPAARPTLKRVFAFNRALREIAERHGAVLLDIERDGLVDARLWADDRLHANPDGHARIAHAAAHALGVEPDEDPWTPLPPAEQLRRARAWAREAVWAGRYMAPWVVRRVRGRSSGDGIAAKRPELAPVDPVAD